MGNAPIAASTSLGASIDWNQWDLQRVSTANLQQYGDEAPEAEDTDAVGSKMQEFSSHESDDVDASHVASSLTPSFTLHEAACLKMPCPATSKPVIPMLDLSSIQPAANNVKTKASISTSATKDLPSLLNQSRLGINAQRKCQIQVLSDKNEHGNSHCVPQALGEFQLQTFSDKYETQSFLRQNGFGVVLACRPRSFDSDTSESTPRIGVVHPKRSPRKEDLDKLAKEGLLLKKLKHPNIHKCLDVFCEGACCHVVTETLQGGSLLDVTEDYRSRACEIPLEVTVRLASQMAESLRYLHSECIVHRDVREANYLCRHPRMDDPSACIVLSGFGLATECAPDSRLHVSCGTTLYMPPETLKNDYGIKVDIWAMGVVLYNLVYGRLPFKNQLAIKYKELNLNHNIEVTSDCRDVLLQMLQKNETHRISADELVRHPFFNPRLR